MFIQSIGVAGSHFKTWKELQAVFNGTNALSDEPSEIFKTTILKPNEARRTSVTIKMVLQAAEETLSQSAFTANQLFSVFISSDGDPNILQSICQELATEDKFISPTQFHNSVHNAPAGYWSIGHQAMKGANSLACGDSSLAGGLVEASSLLDAGEDAILLVCFDLKSPSPLNSARAINYSLAHSMIITQDQQAESICAVDFDIKSNADDVSIMQNAALSDYCNDSPASRGLPFLEALASPEAKNIVLHYSSSLVLDLNMFPCK